MFGNFYNGKLFAFGLSLLSELDPGLSQFEKKGLIGRVDRGTGLLKAFGRAFLIFFRS